MRRVSHTDVDYYADRYMLPDIPGLEVGDIVSDLASDLRDARAEIARLRALVKAAFWEGHSEAQEQWPNNWEDTKTCRALEQEGEYNGP